MVIFTIPFSQQAMLYLWSGDLAPTPKRGPVLSPAFLIQGKDLERAKKEWLVIIIKPLLKF